MNEYNGMIPHSQMMYNVILGISLTSASLAYKIQFPDIRRTNYKYCLGNHKPVFSQIESDLIFRWEWNKWLSFPESMKRIILLDEYPGIHDNQVVIDQMGVVTAARWLVGHNDSSIKGMGVWGAVLWLFSNPHWQPAVKLWLKGHDPYIYIYIYTHTHIHIYNYGCH